MISAEYPGPWNLRTILGPLSRGAGDPCYRRDGDALWLTGVTPEPFTACLEPGVRGTFWGPGAQWAAQMLPRWLGADDDPAGFVPQHPIVESQWRRHQASWRVPTTMLTWQIAVAAVLEQRVTGVEARGAWRRLVHDHGSPAPGPRGDLRIPPTPQALLKVPSWDWRRYEVDRQRIQTLREVARSAHALDTCDLTAIPGIGVWTAAEITSRAHGDADAVSFGDYHLARNVTWALTGRDGGTDDDMAELLKPYAGHRFRAVRMIELAGAAPPRRGPRMRLPGPR